MTQITNPYARLDNVDGLTLRDYFAAKAMLGFISEPVEGSSDALVLCLDLTTADEFAASAYKMADAMLLARNKGCILKLLAASKLAREALSDLIANRDPVVYAEALRALDEAIGDA